MVAANSIRAGRAFVEISVEDAEFGKRLAIDKRRLEEIARSGSALDQISSKLKTSALEDRQSGAARLATTLSGGPDSIAGGLADLAGVANFGVAAAGIHAITAATGTFLSQLQEVREGKKTWAEVADATARSIPILGDVYGVVRQVRELFDGTANEAHRIAEEIRNSEREGRRLAAVLRTVKEIKEITTGAQGRYDELILSPDDLQRKRINQQADDDLKKLRSDRESVLANTTGAARASRLADIDAAMGLVQGARRAALDKIDREANQKEQDQIYEFGRQAIDAEKRLQKEKSDLRAKQLEEQGFSLEAELERIRQNYAERIDAAKTYEEQKVIAQQQALDEMKARENDVFARSGLSAADIERARKGFAASEGPALQTGSASFATFSGAAALATGGYGPAAVMIDLVRQILAESKKTSENTARSGSGVKVGR